jgi:hypothetical protein
MNVEGSRTRMNYAPPEILYADGIGKLGDHLTKCIENQASYREK